MGLPFLRSSGSASSSGATRSHLSGQSSQAMARQRRTSASLPRRPVLCVMGTIAVAAISCCSFGCTLRSFLGMAFTGVSGGRSSARVQQQEHLHEHALGADAHGVDFVGGERELLRPALGGARALRVRRPRVSLAATLKKPKFKEEYITPREAEEELRGYTLALKLDVWGFTEFETLIEFLDNNTALYHTGVIAKEPGEWKVFPGDGDAEDDGSCYLQFEQPMTEIYQQIFDTSPTIVYRGRMYVDPEEIRVEEGYVFSYTPDMKGLIKEGEFSAVIADEEEADRIRKKNRELFERALYTPKGESSGFKTAARIAREGTRLRLKPGSRGRGLDDLR